LTGLRLPAFAEIVLEGHIYPDAAHASGLEHALEGPFGDHTGCYNEQDWFPVFTIDRITQRRDPIYHSTYTGKQAIAPDKNRCCTQKQARQRSGRWSAQPAVGVPASERLNRTSAPLCQTGRAPDDRGPPVVPPPGIRRRSPVAARWHRWPARSLEVVADAEFMRQIGL